MESPVYQIDVWDSFFILIKEFTEVSSMKSIEQMGNNVVFKGEF